MTIGRGLLVFLCLISYNLAPAFRSQSLSVDSSKDSTVSCYHRDAHYIRLTVRWSNGTVMDHSSSSDIIYHNCFQSDTLCYTVTVPSKPEYDGIQVDCHAIFDDTLEPTQPILTLTTTSLRTMNISVGETAVYKCAACSRIDWLLNGTDLNNLNLTSRGSSTSDITVTSRQAADGCTRVSTLSIIGRLDYNNTSIGCQALGSPGRLPDVYLYVHPLQHPVYNFTVPDAGSTPSWIIVTVVCICGFLLLARLAIAAAVLIYKCVYRKWVKRPGTTERGSSPPPQLPPQPHPTGTGSSIELESVQEFPHVDESHESETPFEITSPEEEMNKEVKHRKDGPLPRMNRPVRVSDDGDRSSAFGVGLLPHQQQMYMETTSTLVCIGNIETKRDMHNDHH